MKKAMLNVLIIDDDPNATKILGKILKAKGFEAEEASSGADALSRIQSKFFNLALIDIKLPDMSGMELLKTLRSFSPETIAIMITGFATLNSSIEAMNSGAYAYITKPVNMDQTLMIIDKALEKQVMARELRESADAIRELNRQIEFILGATKTGLDIVDADLNLKYVDSQWQKVYGDYKGRKCYEYFMGAREACPGCGAVKALMSKQMVVSEEVLVREGNRPIQVITFPYQNDNGDWLAAEINVDITALKIEQKERLDLEKQLFQSQKMEAIGSMTGGIVHDMNNILSAVSAFSSLFLSEYSKKDEKRTYIQNIQDLGKKGTEIVNQIRNFAKPKELLFEPIDIKPIVEETIKLLNTKIKHIAQVSITVIPSQRLPIMGDATQLGQMLLNLISNSCDAMEGKWGKLDITIDEVSFMQNALPLPELKAGRYLKLTIKDSGKGMPPEVRERIFEPFFTTKGEKGTGLGLSIVKRVIKSHGGAVSVESAPGKGTTFYMYFPVVSKI